MVKIDNHGIELIKQFIKDIYYLYADLERKKGELTNKLIFIEILIFLNIFALFFFLPNK